MILSRSGSLLARDVNGYSHKDGNYLHSISALPQIEASKNYGQSQSNSELLNPLQEILVMIGSRIITIVIPMGID